MCQQSSFQNPLCIFKHFLPFFSVFLIFPYLLTLCWWWKPISLYLDRVGSIWLGPDLLPSDWPELDSTQPDPTLYVILRCYKTHIQTLGHLSWKIKWRYLIYKLDRFWLPPPEKYFDSLFLFTLEYLPIASFSCQLFESVKYFCWWWKQISFKLILKKKYLFTHQYKFMVNNNPKHNPKWNTVQGERSLDISCEYNFHVYGPICRIFQGPRENISIYIYI